MIRPLMCILCLALAAHVFAQSTRPAPVASYRDGRLTFAADERGNHVPDFSHAGYRGGGVPIPTAPVRVVVSPAAGDDTARIQGAIDYVAGLPADEAGLRGAVLLSPGRYEVSESLTIAVSGVVLRGSGIGNTTIVATGDDRRTLITVRGKLDRQVDSRPVAIADDYVPVGATRLRLSADHGLSLAQPVLVRRPSTPEWIATIGMDNMGGERHGFSWRPGSRDITWERIITAVDGATVTLDAPITTAIDAAFGGGDVARYDWPGRIEHVGIENLRLESAFDATNPRDEAHAWCAIVMENVRDGWVRQVDAAHFAGSAVMLWETCSRVTVEDVRYLAPVSENGGGRRNAFFTAGGQTLFQRCYAESARHAFAVGFVAPGPIAFVQCEATDALVESGPIDSWASGVLFDNVRIDGNALTLGNRWHRAQGAGWSAANSVLWNCSAALITCDAPPTAVNWALGCWGSFAGRGTWQSANDSIDPRSLYGTQLRQRLGESETSSADLLPVSTEGSTSPTPEQAARMVAVSSEPAVTLRDWIGSAAQRRPIPIDSGDAPRVEQVWTPPPDAMIAVYPIELIDGVLRVSGKPMDGGILRLQWWRGSARPAGMVESGPAITRFSPGRVGRGATDDLDALVESMRRDGKSAVEHHYGLWYDRRRDDHQRVRRIDGDVAAPFFEQPFARSGGDKTGFDGLSRYDLTKFNPWYWSRLKQFADLADRNGLALIQQHYFQHNILEAGAHWTDSPWRSANNINNTGFPEPPPYAGDKRIFQAHLFYDVDHPVRRELHRAYIRKCLDNFDGNSNVIHSISAEFTGPLHFAQFWIDTIAEWQRESRRDVLVMLSTTRDVQDAILSDPARSPIVDIIDIRYWWYQDNGDLYAPPGGQNLAPRQWARVLKPRPPSAEQAARAVKEYREKHPGKAVIFSADGSEKFGDALRAAGASMAEIGRRGGDANE